MKTKPFNLSLAMLGKPVIDNSGRIGKYIHTINNPTPGYYEFKHIFELVTEKGKGFIMVSDDNGNTCFMADFDSRETLSMKCEEKEYYIASGISSLTKELYSTRPYLHEDDAISNLADSISLMDETLQTHKIIRYE